MITREIVRLYLETGASNLRKDTLEKTTMVLDDFNRSMGDKHLEELKGHDLLRWLQAHREWNSDWTRKRALGIAKRPFNWATDVGLIKGSPFGRISWQDGERGQPMSEENFRRLLRRSSPAFRRVLLFLRFSGCRPGEMLQLTWGHYDHQRHCFTLRRHKTSRKTGRPRHIVLNHQLRRLIEWLRRNQPHEPGDRVFLNSWGRPYHRRTFYVRFKAVAQRAGLFQETKLYGLRHSFGTEGVKRGVNLKILSECMGHASVETTEYYVHLAKDTSTLRTAIDSIFR
jgi:integrase